MNAVRLGRAIALTIALAGLVSIGGTTAAGARTTRPPVRHVFVIVLENEAADTTFADTSPAKYLSQTLPDAGAFVPGYFGVTHFSMGNYDALISGQGPNSQIQVDCPVFSDFVGSVGGPDGQALGQGCVFPAGVKTVADQLTQKGLTWKGYMEDMKSPCLHPALGALDTTQRARVGDQYAARHNPFVYFHSIIDSPTCARNDVALTNLQQDLRSRASTANLSFITPNLCNDGHDAPCVDGQPGGLVSADAFLRTWVPRILGSPAYRHDGLLAVLFDEGLDSAACCGQPARFPNTPDNGSSFGQGGGRTGAVLLSPFIHPGTLSPQSYNHFSFLRSVEDLFSLGHLGYAGSAGVRPLGGDVYTCVRRSGSLIESVAVSRGTAPRPTLLVTVRRDARVRVGLAGPHRRHDRRVGGGSASACHTVRVPMPTAHGRAVITARGSGSSARRSVRF